MKDINLSKYSSLFRICSFILTLGFTAIISVLAIISLFMNEKDHALFLLIIMLSSFGLHLILISIEILLGGLFKKRFIVNNDYIKVGNQTFYYYNITRLIFCRVNFANALRLCPGKLVIIYQGKEQEIAILTNRRFNRIKEFFNKEITIL